MKWPWRKDAPRQESTPPVSDDLDEATQARRRSEQALRHEKRRTGEIKNIAADSRRFRDSNHFVELILETFERRAR